MTEKKRMFAGILAGVMLGSSLSGSAVVSASITDGKVLVENLRTGK